MWVIIIIIIIITIIIGVITLYAIGHSAHKSEINNRVRMQGGMLNKYADLVSLIKSNDSKTQIFKISSNSIVLGISNIDGTTKFTIIQDVDTITVEWQLKSQTFGDHRLAWEFPENLDQNKMMIKILNDVKEKNIKIIYERF